MDHQTDRVACWDCGGKGGWFDCDADDGSGEEYCAYHRCETCFGEGEIEVEKIRTLIVD